MNCEFPCCICCPPETSMECVVELEQIKICPKCVERINKREIDLNYNIERVIVNLENLKKQIDIKVYPKRVALTNIKIIKSRIDKICTMAAKKLIEQANKSRGRV